MVKGVVLNDIHFGIKDSQRIYEELKQFIKFLEDNGKDLDIVIFAGDYFDRKLTVGDPGTLYAISFFKNVIDICKKEKLKLRMIQGTRSHELNQLSLFFPFINSEGLDFKIIETVTEEELMPGFNVLYIPEEYPESSEEHYKIYKEKEYNAIFGHGSWDFVSFENQKEQAIRTDILSTPVFVFEEWKDSLKNGFASFGHIHSRHKYKGKIFYSGAFSRWDFSDISERGFTHFEYDTEKKEYKVNFIDNIEAPTFSNFSLSSIEKIKDMSMSDLQTVLNEVIDKFDNIYIDVSGISKDKQELIRNQYRDSSNVKIRSSDRVVMLKESEDQEKKFKKYDYIIKRELPLNETIKRYIKEEYSKNISLGKIKEVLDDGKK